MRPWVLKIASPGRILLGASPGLDASVHLAGRSIDEDGILILDLRTAKISPRSANHPRNRAKS